MPWQSPPELWEKLKPLARQMRREPTPAEKLLWQKLRQKQLLGFKFRRQHAIDRFIVDFYCAKARERCGGGWRNSRLHARGRCNPSGIFAVFGVASGAV